MIKHPYFFVWVEIEEISEMILVNFITILIFKYISILTHKVDTKSPSLYSSIHQLIIPSQDLIYETLPLVAFKAHNKIS